MATPPCADAIVEAPRAVAMRQGNVRFMVKPSLLSSELHPVGRDCCPFGCVQDETAAGSATQLPRPPHLSARDRRACAQHPGIDDGRVGGILRGGIATIAIH